MRFEEIRQHLKKDFIAFAYSFHYNLEAYLYPEEEEIIRGAVPSRQEEFAKGRQCARLAIDEITGRSRYPILQGTLGEPLFDSAVIGSIAHTDRFYVAAVAFQHKIAGLGVDIEENQTRDIDWSLIAEYREISQCKTYNITPITLFSLKESLIKCFSPLAGKKLFYDAFDVTFLQRPRMEVFNPVRFIYNDQPELSTETRAGFFISENGNIVSIAYILK